jgi:hypothetical protein
MAMLPHARVERFRLAQVEECFCHDTRREAVLIDVFHGPREKINYSVMAMLLHARVELVVFIAWTVFSFVQVYERVFQGFPAGCLYDEVEVLAEKKGTSTFLRS